MITSLFKVLLHWFYEIYIIVNLMFIVLTAFEYLIVMIRLDLSKKKQKLNQSTVDDDDGRRSVRSNDTEKTLLEVRPPKKKKEKKTKPTGKEIGPRDESEC